MSALGETCRTAVAPVGELLAGLILSLAKGAVRGVQGAWDIVRGMQGVFEQRHVLAQLSGLDDHMLRDIGINRADLRDAASAPLSQDPTAVLVLRATERRTSAALHRRLRHEPERSVLHVVR